MARASPRSLGLRLFVVGFLVLFLELASIRWFAGHVVFLQFFTNLVLIASFLGMSCGCLAARQRREWLEYFPLPTLTTIVATIAVFISYQLARDAIIERPQEVFNYQQYRNLDIARFAVPIELVAAAFFVLIAFMFVGPGQVLGRSLDRFPNRVVAYSLNIGGSLAGILGFSALAMMHAPPVVWFLVVAAAGGYLLHQAGSLTFVQALVLALAPVAAALPGLAAGWAGIDLMWSPYNAVYHYRAKGDISANGIVYQSMRPFDTADSDFVLGSAYSLIYLLEDRSGGPPFRDVLVIGAGTGNDVNHALHFGAARVDAVEIDPVILGIGIANHPDRPYQDLRVNSHLDDGRHFLHNTGRKYDLVVYPYVDSLVFHSSYANIRLESYLYTRQAFADIHRVLKPGGVFYTFNFFRQGWIVERVAAMAEATFGCKPLVFELPYREVVRSSSPSGLTAILTTCDRRIADAFVSHGSFWVHNAPPRNLDVNGFTENPALLPVEEQAKWQRIAPATLIHDGGTPSPATDDWPFLYLHGRLIPDLTLRSIVLLGGLGLAMVYLFLPKKRGPQKPRAGIEGRMFFLGAAFMLLETKAVVQLALVFGSTWLVNSLVFTAVLILILLANLYVLRWPGVRLHRHYAGLLGLLALGMIVPTDLFLAGGALWRWVLPCALALGPMFFAGVIFARSFRDTSDPDQAFGANIAGSVVGGFSESISMLFGFRYLLLLAALFYLLSAWVPAWRLRKAS